MKNVLNAQVTFEDKSFNGENGLVEFTDVIIPVCGEPIRCRVQKADKALFEYLRKKLPEVK